MALHHISVLGRRASKEFVAQESGTGGKERSSQSETQTDGEFKLENVLKGSRSI